MADDTEFVEQCHFSETGFALWRRDKQGRAYCTCDPRGKPDGWICETTKPTPGEWLREHNGRAMTGGNAMSALDRLDKMEGGA
jgi:hypothetical protein